MTVKKAGLILCAGIVQTGYSPSTHNATPDLVQAAILQQGAAKWARVSGRKRKAPRFQGASPGRGTVCRYAGPVGGLFVPRRSHARLTSPGTRSRTPCSPLVTPSPRCASGFGPRRPVSASRARLRNPAFIYTALKEPEFPAGKIKRSNAL